MDQVRLTQAGASYKKNGGLLGVHAFLKHNADGTDGAFCCNGGTSAPDGESPGVLPQAVNAIEDTMATNTKWPSIDLFDCALSE